MPLRMAATRRRCQPSFRRRRIRGARHAPARHVIPPAAISCRSRDRPTCRIACCARSTRRRSTIAAPSSRRSARTVLRRHEEGVQDRRRRSSSIPASGTGAWEAALVNTLSPGDRVLMAETGHFATLWKKLAERLGLAVEFLPGDWRHGVDPPTRSRRGSPRIAAHAIKAVCVVHNETSTGVTSRIPDVRAAIDRAGHPALLHGRHDLLARLDRLPPRRMGRRRHRRRLAEGADAAAGPVVQRDQRARRSRRRRRAKLPRSYWDWSEMLAINPSGYLPVHAGDQPALRARRGARHAVRRRARPACSRATTGCAEATRRAVRAWGLEILCADPALNTARR